MPELAEVEFFRRQWDVAVGKPIERVRTHPQARIFRDAPAEAVKNAIEGRVLFASEAQAKQMLFRFGPEVWLGLHLGMAGKLEQAPVEMVPSKHDHLVLYTPDEALVFSDYRMFGKLELHLGVEAPAWWTRLAPPVLSDEFTREVVGAFCARRAKAPIKAVLLMQERFPGIGNWMADEILWRARIHPATPAGALSKGRKLTELHRRIQEVANDAMREIAGLGAPTVPHTLNERVPEDWLFNHRWRDGGTCPQTGKPLVREEIGGRTTCFSPAWQRWQG
jgi:formamidopyrimidine-DNA glycosylase